MSGHGKVGFLAVLLVVLAVLGGCGGHTSTTTDPPQMANLRVAQGNSSIGNINVAVDGAVLASNIAFLANTGYLSVQAGVRQLTIQGATNPPNLTLPENLAANSKNTFVLDGWGPFSSGQVLLLDDTTPPPASSFKLRILDGALSTPATLDVYILSSGSTPGGTPTIAAMTFNNASSYQTLAAGSYHVFFTSAGTTTVLFDSGPMNFATGQNRTFVLVNNCTPTACSQNTFTSILLADLN